MNNAALLASLQKSQQGGGPPALPTKTTISKPKPATPTCPTGQLFHYDQALDAFLWDLSLDVLPTFIPDQYGNADTNIQVPLAPCIYRLTDYTLAKKEPILRQRCLSKLGVLRCLQRERDTLNRLLWHRLSPVQAQNNDTRTSNLPRMPSLDSSDSSQRMPTATNRPHIVGGGNSIEEDELGKVRFMELLSNCGIYQRVSEMILQRAARVTDAVRHGNKLNNTDQNPYGIPQITVHGLDDFLQTLEDLTPDLAQARQEIAETQTVSFYPGLGELFTPGSPLLCFPDGMEGVPMGVSVVQNWYQEDTNPATGKVKRRFILVVEFVVSVGSELVFVAASEVYPEFHDTSRNARVADLKHRKLHRARDAELLQRLQQRGEFYASVATSNVFAEYQPNVFFPIISGGWSNNAVRPLTKGGRVMIDVARGILENIYPIRGTADGMSDTVKEAIKLFESNKRTGIAVPFRTAILPEFSVNGHKTMTTTRGDSDRPQLWQAWPCVVGFSFTSRVWGKLLLTLPSKASIADNVSTHPDNEPESPRRAAVKKLGVQRAGLGGLGKCGSCGFIHFMEKAFEQLVLAEDKKELIRAVARNAGGGTKFDEDEEDEDEEDFDDMGLDVVANKGAASIFLLSGGPGTGKTLTAEAIAELLQKPLYVVTAGDLGITAGEVEKSLGSVLELCQTWDALVLIDEADIFLEQRQSSEIQRNALVCVMLRLLEYYSGCLFLSSNRSTNSIDAAIASRITVMLTYPPLDATGRAKVWKNLVELVPALPKNAERVLQNPRKASRYRENFSDNDYTSLATAYETNGRQIKNSIVLARALARERGAPLSMSILQRAVTAVAGEATGGKSSGASY